VNTKLDKATLVFSVRKDRKDILWGESGADGLVFAILGEENI